MLIMNNESSTNSNLDNDKAKKNRSFYRRTICFIINTTYSHYFAPIKIKKAISLDNKSQIPNRYPMLMSPSEKDILKKYTSKSKKYLEFGSGGSTFYVLKNSPSAMVISVESDAGWIEFMRKWNYICESENNRLKIHIVDIGPTGDGGVPLQMEKKELYPDYSSSVFSQINPEYIDTVLVDGRFRVACILQTILHCPQDVVILVHDFKNRFYYHAILNFLDEIEFAETLVVFKIKPDINYDQVRECYEYFKYDWQ
jgi:hypothetical protein